MPPHSYDKPTFLLLRARLPAEDATKLLGRFVTHPGRPLDNSEPKDPLAIIKNEPVKITEKAASIEVSSVNDKEAKAKVKGLVDLSANGNKITDTNIDDTTVTTYRLQDHYKAFDALIESPDVKKSLQGPKGLMSRSKGVLYMVVGIKTCSEGTTFKSKNAGGMGFGASLTVPLSQAFHGIPIANPELGVSLNEHHSNTAGFKTVDEQVFAVEYKKVKQRNLWGYAESAEPKIGHDVMAQEWENGVFKRDKGDAEDDDAAFDDDLNESLAKEDVANDAATDVYFSLTLSDEEVAQDDVSSDDFVLI
jgi:hypothetical protein